MDVYFLILLAAAAVGFVISRLALKAMPDADKKRLTSIVIGTMAITFFLTSAVYELGWLSP